MYQALIWHRDHRGGSGVAPALEELMVQWRDCCGGNAAAALMEGSMLACMTLTKVTHPAEGNREGFWRRRCLDGDVRDEQEFAREGRGRRANGMRLLGRLLLYEQRKI